MKKIFIAFLFSLSLIFGAQAQNIHITTTYAFHTFNVLDRNFNLIESIPNTGDPLGLYSLSNADGKEYIIVTMGKDPIYTIQVVNVVRGNEEDFKIDMFQGGMSFQGQTVPINVFVEYDKGKRTTIPDNITIDVHNSPTLIELSGLIPVHK